MWVAKFKIWHKNCLLRQRCVKYQVTDFVYLINSWIEKKKFYYTELHILQGKEENKRKFIRDLKKEKSIKKLEQSGNYIFTLNEESMKIKDVPVFDVELIYIKKTKLSDIFLPHIYPKLSPKQKEAIELAVKQGYYEFPRKIELEKLAEISGVKRQTYQENLRRAERKLVPFLTESLS